jgi:chemotaxis protein MotA
MGSIKSLVATSIVLGGAWWVAEVPPELGARLFPLVMIPVGVSAFLWARFSWSELVLGCRCALELPLHSSPPLDKVINEIVRLTTLARQEGLFRLDREIAIHTEPFMKKALSLAADGTSGGALHAALDIEFSKLKERDDRGVDVVYQCSTAAAYMGVLLFLILLGRTLSPLPNIEQLGPNLEVTFWALATGFVLGVALVRPLAQRAQSKLYEKRLVYQAITEGFVALVEGENPRIIRQKLSGFHRLT